jgi:hypothetical protein
VNLLLPFFSGENIVKIITLTPEFLFYSLSSFVIYASTKILSRIVVSKVCRLQNVLALENLAGVGSKPGRFFFADVYVNVVRK